MQNIYRPVETISLGETFTFVWPKHHQLDLNSPAIHFMTDFQKTHPLVVSENTEVDEALRIMKQGHVRLLLVTRNDEFVGVITAPDINGGKVLAYMGCNAVSHRDEVLVRHVMVDRAHIHGLDIDAIKDCSIGNVLETIKLLNEQHILVVEKHLTSCSVRGLFSATEIAPALQIKLSVEPYAKTFFELEQVIVNQVNRH